MASGAGALIERTRIFLESIESNSAGILTIACRTSSRLAAILDSLHVISEMPVCSKEVKSSSGKVPVAELSRKSSITFTSADPIALVNANPNLCSNSKVTCSVNQTCFCFSSFKAASSGVRDASVSSGDGSVFTESLCLHPMRLTTRQNASGSTRLRASRIQ